MMHAYQILISVLWSEPNSLYINNAHGTAKESGYFSIAAQGMQRKRAKSYPADEKQSEPIPMLELPKQLQPCEEEDESRVSIRVGEYITMKHCYTNEHWCNHFRQT